MRPIPSRFALSPTLATVENFAALPIVARGALARTHETLNDAATWVWFHASTIEERAAMDAYLVATHHPLACEPGSPESRFRDFLRMCTDQGV